MFGKDCNAGHHCDIVTWRSHCPDKLLRTISSPRQCQLETQSLDVWTRRTLSLIWEFGLKCVCAFTDEKLWRESCRFVSDFFVKITKLTLSLFLSLGKVRSAIRRRTLALGHVQRRSRKSVSGLLVDFSWHERPSSNRRNLGVLVGSFFDAGKDLIQHPLQRAAFRVSLFTLIFKIGFY